MIKNLPAKFKVIITQACRDGFIPLPVQRWEWLCMRLLFALLVCYSLQEFKPYNFNDQPVPRGLANFFDLTFLSHPGPIDLSAINRIEVPLLGALRLHGPGWFDTVFVLSAVLSALYVWGRGLLITLPLLTLVHLLPWTLSNSQGFTHHGLQLVTMVALVQSIVVWWWQVRQWRGKPAMPLGLPSYFIYYSQGMVAFSYVACAFTKIINTKGLWLWQSNYICIELIKSHRLAYFDRLDPENAGDPESALWLLNHPWTTRMIFDTGFFLEMFAFVALLNRKWALGTGLCIVAFHRSAWTLMRLEFPMHEALVLIFMVNAPFWVLWLKRSKAV